jgi:hypothetical protein
MSERIDFAELTRMTLAGELPETCIVQDETDEPDVLIIPFHSDGCLDTSFVVGCCNHTGIETDADGLLSAVSEVRRRAAPYHFKRSNGNG